MENQKREGKDMVSVLSFFDAYGKTRFYSDLLNLDLPEVLSEGTFIMHRFEIKPKESVVQMLNDDQNIKRFNHHPWHGIVLKSNESNKLIPGTIVLLKRNQQNPGQMTVFNETFLEVVYNLDVWFYYHPDKAIRYLEGIKDRIVFE